MQGIFDVATLRESAGVQQVRQTGPRTFQLVVDDAGTATPDAIQAMAEQGAEVESIRELRPTFEEVCTALVDRSRSGTAESDTATPDAAGPDDDGHPGDTEAAA